MAVIIPTFTAAKNPVDQLIFRRASAGGLFYCCGGFGTSPISIEMLRNDE